MNRVSGDRAPHPPSQAGVPALGERLVAFKRFYRWLNLTLVHQALWPLLVLLTSAHGDSPEATPMPWYLARLAGPAIAAAAAAVYLRQRLPWQPGDAAGPREQPDQAGRRSWLRGQVAFACIGLPLMLAAARLAVHPTDATVKLLLFGLADVAAYQTIHFGVVARSYPDRDQGRAAAVILFACSWAIHDALLTGLGAVGGSLPLAFAGGLALGLGVAVVSLAVREWTGRSLPAAGLHWLVIYLVFGFTR